MLEKTSVGSDLLREKMAEMNTAKSGNDEASERSCQ